MGHMHSFVIIDTKYKIYYMQNRESTEGQMLFVVKGVCDNCYNNDLPNPDAIKRWLKPTVVSMVQTLLKTG